MAKAELHFGPERLPSFRGSFYLRRHRGQLVMCKWPKKQTRVKSEARKKSMQLFADASEAIKLMHSSQIERAKDITPGTQALWRDALILSLYGRLPAILTIDGQEYRPMASRKDVTDILDSLGLVEGGILYRDNDYWKILPPGEPGQVLSINAVSGMVYWRDVAGGGGGGVGTLLCRTTDGPTSSSWPRFADYEQAIYDDGGSWNPAFPDRVYIPPTATRFRVSWGCNWTPNTASSSWFYTLRDQDDVAPGPAFMAQNYRWATGNYSNNAMAGVSPWYPKGDIEYIRLRILSASGGSTGLRAGTWLQLETA